MILTTKKEFIIKLFCVMIIIGLNIAVFVNGRSLDCSNCAMEFTSFKRGLSASNKVYQTFTVKIEEMYSTFMNDECIIDFDKDNGYYYSDEEVLK